MIDELEVALKKAKEKIVELNEKYNSDVVVMQKEIKYLKEQLMAQQGMLNNAVDYASKLEVDFKKLRKDIDTNSFENIP